MCFIVVQPEWSDFDNEDHDWGPGEFVIEIAFLDENGIVIDIKNMPAYIGRATPPKGTRQAIEALSGYF